MQYFCKVITKLIFIITQFRLFYIEKVNFNLHFETTRYRNWL